MPIDIFETPVRTSSVFAFCCAALWLQNKIYVLVFNLILYNNLFQALFELELAGCNEITEAGLWACLNPRIVSLTLTDCINVADEAVGAVAQLLPGLYEFSLQAYHVTDAALGYFSPKQSNSLNILRLHSCWELTNHGIVNIGE